MSDRKPQIQEAQRIPSRINTKKQTKILHLGISYSTYRKSKIFKSLERSQRGKKHFTDRVAKIKIRSDLSAETMQAKRE